MAETAIQEAYCRGERINRARGAELGKLLASLSAEDGVPVFFNGSFGIVDIEGNGTLNIYRGPLKIIRSSGRGRRIFYSVEAVTPEGTSRGLTNFWSEGEFWQLSAKDPDQESMRSHNYCLHAPARQGSHGGKLEARFYISVDQLNLNSLD